MRSRGGAVTAPHQDERVEEAIRLGVGLGVDHAAGLLRGVVRVSGDVRLCIAGGAEAAIRAALRALGISPRVDVTAGPAATVTVVLHDTEDPGASPDTMPE